MAIFTVTLDGDAVPFEVYGGLPACVHYLRPASDDSAIAFKALSSDDQGSRLIDATRYIDEMMWQGAATGLVGVDPTTLQWPRSGLTDQYGNPLDSTTVPIQVVNAAFEMAAILAGDPSASSNVDQGSNLQSMGAGGASLSFFRPTSAADGTASRLPTVVDRLIGRWLASSVSVAGGFISGTNAHSNFLSVCDLHGVENCGCSGQRRDVRWPV